MKKDVVSIITPCYNGEKFLNTFLDSVLNQTYKYIEFIIINDGSKDKSEEIILGYKELFEKKGYIFKYIYQENAGQAAAVNKGLKIFEGEYLMWVDSDDILKNNNVDEKVKFLKANKQYGMVMCKTEVVNETDLSKRINILERKPKKYKKDNLFESLIMGINVYFPPGGYMVTTKAFLEAIPSRDIYESRIGQNWQLLLPISYKNKCGYLNEILFTYVVRKGSHSRIKKQEEDLIERTLGEEDVLNVTINSIDMSQSEKNKYLKIAKDKYERERLRLYYRFNDIENIKKQYMKMKKENSLITIKERVIYLSTKGNIQKKICKILYIFAKVLEVIEQKIKY